MISWVEKIAAVGCALLGNNYLSAIYQCKSEYDNAIIESRLSKLEDPISCLDRKVPEVSIYLYSQLGLNDFNIDIDDTLDFDLIRVLKLLSAAGYIEYNGGLVSFINPEYVFYMASLHEKNHILNELVGYIHDCQSGCHIQAEDLSKSLNVPLALVLSLFDIYTRKGFGLYDKTVGHESYFVE